MAIQTLAAESYVLGDMTPVEREEFERHFFECAECAQDVRDAVDLMDASRATGAKERLQPVLPLALVSSGLPMFRKPPV